jgi:uncharacterized protein (TIGR02996 family)
VQQNLLQAIHESPADNSLRLVLADWLAEHGEAERAEFIRIQVELHGVSSSFLLETPRQIDLRRREKELLAEHRHAWLGPLVSLEAGPRGAARGTSRKVLDAKFSFERGLPQVRLGPDAQPLPDLLDAPQWDWVVDLQWHSGWRAANVLHFLSCARLAQRKHLTVRGNKTKRSSREEVAALVASPRLARITTLDLCGNQLDATAAAALAASPHLAGLTELDLTFNKIGDEGAAALAASSAFCNLSTLRLRGSNISVAGATALATSLHVARLTTLDLSENEIGNDGVAALAASRHLARLTDLNLRMNRIGNEGATTLGASPHLALLTSVDLSWNDIDKDGATAQALRTRFGQRVKL